MQTNDTLIGDTKNIDCPLVRSTNLQIHKTKRKLQLKTCGRKFLKDC